MRTLLSDPIWQFVGSTIAFAAFVVSIYLFLLQRRKKSLSYEILTDTDLLTIDETIKGNIKIVFDGNPIQNMTLIVLEVVNNGNVPITSSDFERSLTFSFGTSTVVSSEIIRKQPTSLSPELHIGQGQIELKPMLLNSKDSVTIKVLVSEYVGVIDADARIVGVRKVKKIESRKWRKLTIGTRSNLRSSWTSFSRPKIWMATRYCGTR